jgi:hypothetical protein
MNTRLLHFYRVNMGLSVTESEDESTPKKPVAPVNGKAAKKAPAK